MSQTKGFSIIIESPGGGGGRGKNHNYLTVEMQMTFKTNLMCITFWVANNCDLITNKPHKNIREKMCMCLLEQLPEASSCIIRLW